MPAFDVSISEQWIEFNGYGLQGEHANAVIAALIPPLRSTVRPSNHPEKRATGRLL